MSTKHSIKANICMWILSTARKKGRLSEFHFEFLFLNIYSIACLKMFNNEHQQGLFTSTMDPRISFSNDFGADPHQGIKYEGSYREAPVSSDFEFSVKNYAMIPADEIFFKGVLLPSKDNGRTEQGRELTLRDTLLVDDDDDDDNGFGDSLPRLQKGSGRWKERLGLKWTSLVYRKEDGNDPILGKAVEDKSTMFVQDLISNKR